MPSLETLRKAILSSLEENRSLLVGLAECRFPELAGKVAEDVAVFIATEAIAEGSADVPEPADGGFGARHKGRPRQTVADQLREAYEAAVDSDSRRAASEIEPLGVLLELLRQEREDKP